MRVEVYIDGLNLYYGGRHLCGRGKHRWRWLDLAALADRLIGRNPGDGAGGHWWYSLTADDFFSCQLPESVDTHRRPDRW